MAALSLGQDGGGLTLGAGGQAESGFTGQGGHDGGELGGGVAGELDDGGKPSGQRRVSGEQGAERVFAATTMSRSGFPAMPPTLCSPVGRIRRACYE